MCFPIDELNANARAVVESYGITTTYSDAGCVDPLSATVANPGCIEIVSEGVRTGDSCCYYRCFAPPGCGRPFSVGEVARVAAPRTSVDWCGSRQGSAAVLPEAEARLRQEVADEWLRDALAEHASIAAFSAFSLSLLAVGAPAELVRASAAATRDEVEHARACFGIASQYAGRSQGPAELEVGELRIATDLVDVAVSTFVESCVGETSAALVAHAQLAVAESTTVRTVLGRIAEDETRHAELGWRFVAWAVQQGGAPVVRALQTTVQRLLGESVPSLCHPSEPAAVEWHRAGRLSAAERRDIAAHVLSDLVQPALASLIEQHAATRVRRSSVGVSSPNA
jgi:hypothetical protein